MKIECTKNEWIYLTMCLLDDFQISSEYNHPYFSCDIHHEEGILKIEGFFVD